MRLITGILFVSLALASFSSVHATESQKFLTGGFSLVQTDLETRLLDPQWAVVLTRAHTGSAAYFADTGCELHFNLMEQIGRERGETETYQFSAEANDRMTPAERRLCIREVYARDISVHHIPSSIRLFEVVIAGYEGPQYYSIYDMKSRNDAGFSDRIVRVRHARKGIYLHFAPWRKGDHSLVLYDTTSFREMSRLSLPVTVPPASRQIEILSWRVLRNGTVKIVYRENMDAPWKVYLWK